MHQTRERDLHHGNAGAHDAVIVAQQRRLHRCGGRQASNSAKRRQLLLQALLDDRVAARERQASTVTRGTVFDTAGTKCGNASK
jgi:hypothetical protein